MGAPGWSMAGVAAVVVVTLAAGSLGLRRARTTGDFYVASRAVTPRWNAAAVSGEYLSAASFLGIAGLVLTYGFDMLWYPVGYTAGYLVLLTLVAAPLRRSGAYTLPDFAQLRLGSGAVRRTASLLVVLIGWLYLVPQLQGAALTLTAQVGAPRWAGGALVCAVVLAAVASGGMRSITFAQAVQYWIKLTALLVPAAVLTTVWRSRGDRLPGPADGGGWLQPLGSGLDHPLYATLSLIVAICLGTMGLPHVLVRFYTNPDGRDARRTALIVIGLLAVFYQLPTLLGVFGHRYLPELAGSRSDTTVLLLPERMLPGLPGQVLAGLVTAGAFAAFLSTASGLTVSVAGVLSQDLAPAPRRRHQRIRRFRASAVVAIGVPYLLSLSGVRISVAATVGLAFALAACTFCPLLVLSIWWRGLTDVGALAGLATGGVLAGAAVLTTLLLAPRGGWPGALLSQPAACIVPLTFAVMIGGSLVTRSRVPGDVGRVLLRLHAPESMSGDLPSLNRSAR
jgi:cation/acetate symporter